jgi:hypothetical protein
MPAQAPLPGDLSQQEKILLAHGGSLDASGPSLHLLILLADDSDQEVSRAAQQTLTRMPEADCAKLLATQQITDQVARYFLDSSSLRVALLPALLANPTTPQEAIVQLASTGGPGLISQLITHLDLLKTPVLAALKANPAYQYWRQRALAAAGTLFENLGIDPLEDKQRIAGQKRLAELVAAAGGADPDASRTAQATLADHSDSDILNQLTATSLDEQVARYFLALEHVRPALLPVLLAHPDTPADAIVALAAGAGPEAVPTLLDQIDQLKTPTLLALKENPTYLHWQKEPPPEGYVLEVDLLDLLIQEMESQAPPTVEQLEAAFSDTGTAEQGAETPERGGIVTKIARMKVAQRVKLALLGTREERALLIRDTSRVVYRAVLGSPKLTETEVEGFATQKNVGQDVLRMISMNRKFMKNYTILKNLATNPRTPIDVSLPLLNRLLPNDVRMVASSRDVPETIRKMAQKLLRSRSSSGG